MATPLFEIVESTSLNNEIDLAQTISGTTARNVLHMAITDTSTIAGGMSGGLRIDYASSGAKTGGTLVPFSVNFTITDDCFYAWGIHISVPAIDNKTIEMLTGISVWMGDPGTACTRYFAFNVNMDNDSAPAAESGMMRFRNSGSRPLDSMFQLESTSPVNHLFNFTKEGYPYHTDIPTNVHGLIRIKIKGTTKCFAVYDMP